MEEPAFKARDGQVDYTDIRYAPVVNTIVVYRNKILLLQRNPKMRLYPGYWNGISGFLDDDKSIEEKVYTELKEELGIERAHVTNLERGKPLIQESPEYNKTWLVVPVKADITTNEFKLDWEASAAKWYDPEEISALDLLPGFEPVIGQFFKITD
jgi:NADH pyrophosphatase NudC (nudix superfamily)